MEIKPGKFYNIEWKDKKFQHCELLEIIPGTSLAAVRTPKYEYFEIHVDYLKPEEDTVQENAKAPVKLKKLEIPEQKEKKLDVSEIIHHVEDIAKSIAIEFQQSSKNCSENVFKQKVFKLDSILKAIELKLQECEKTLNDEYALKKDILKATTIKNVLLEIQQIAG